MRRALVCSLVMVLVGCTAPVPAVTLDAPARAQVRDSVVAALHGYEDARESLDSARIAGFLLADSDFRAAADQMIFTRNDVLAWAGGLRTSLRSYAGGFAYDSLAVVVLSPTEAVTMTPYVDIMTDTLGAVTTVRGRATWVWARRQQGWQIAAAHTVTTPPIVTKQK